MDTGFGFYAPQTRLTADWQRLRVGWMGIPDGEAMGQPTVAIRWIHQLTCLRELSSHQGRLCQQPVAGLLALREQAQANQGAVNAMPQRQAQRLKIVLESQGGIELDFADTLNLTWQQDDLRLARRSLISGERTCR